MATTNADGSIRVDLPVFDKIVEACSTGVLAGQVNRYTAEETAVLGDIDFLNVAKPIDIIVSRRFPGYREADLTGKGAEESLSIGLAKAIIANSSLADFRQALIRVDLPSAIIGELFPRPENTLKRGKYYITDRKVLEVVSKHMNSFGFTNEHVQAAYGHIILRVLVSIELVQTSLIQKALFTDNTFAVPVTALMEVILTDSLRSIFSEAHISSAAKALNADATPTIIAETLTRMFVHVSTSLQEIAYRMEQVRTATDLVQYQIVAPYLLPSAMRGNTDLARLANMANFVVEAGKNIKAEAPVGEIGELREACKMMLTAIQSAPNLEVISLGRFADFFGVVPASAGDGLNRGAIVYLPLAQVSKMQIVDARSIDKDGQSGMQVQAVPGSYTPVTSVATELNRTLLQASSFKGVANLVADELGAAEMGPCELWAPPTLLTLGVSRDDLTFIALAKTASVAIAQQFGTDENGVRKSALGIVYMTRVMEQWRQKVSAATTGVAFFYEPESLIAYELAGKTIDPIALPSRAQHIGVSEASETVYRGQIAEHFITTVELPFDLRVTLRGMGIRDDVILTLKIMALGPILSSLVGENGKGRGDQAHFAAVKEHGVDRDIELALRVIDGYGSGTNDILVDRAKSWLVEVLVGLVTHPAVRQIADRALNAAVLKQGIDARKQTHAFQELVIRVYFGTAMAVLSQFGKIPRDLAVSMLKLTPVTNLSMKAQLGLATIPTTMRPLLPTATE